MTAMILTGAGLGAPLFVVLAMFATGFVWMRHPSGVEDAEPFPARPGRSMTIEDVAVVAP